MTRLPSIHTAGLTVSLTLLAACGNSTSNDADGVGGTTPGTGGEGMGAIGGTNAGGTNTGGAGVGAAGQGGTMTGTGGAGGAGATGGDAGAGGSADPCDDTPCPGFGTCIVEQREEGCVRTCSLFADPYDVATPFDLDGLAGLRCEVIDGSVSISGPFVDLSSLDTIRELEDLSVVDNSELVSFELPALKTVTGRFQFSNNSPEIIRLPSLESVHEFAIVVNPELTSIQMDALQSVDTLWIQANESLLTVHGLPSLCEAGNLYIGGNPQLPQCEVDAILSRVDVGCSGGAGNDPTNDCQ